MLVMMILEWNKENIINFVRVFILCEKYGDCSIFVDVVV